MWNNGLWLKVPFPEIAARQIWHGDMTGRFAYFRCETDLPPGAALTVDITANSRYRLWVNGDAVLSGPCKGDTHRQYYETVELTGFLRPGKNVFCVQVLYCDPDTAEIQTDTRASIYGVIGQRCGHRFALEGEALDSSGSVAGILTTGKADWRVWLDNTFCLVSNEITQFLGAVQEDIDFQASPARWKTPDFDASHWPRAEPAGPVVPIGPLFTGGGVQPRFRMRAREIPLLYEQETAFVRAFRQSDGKDVGLLENGSITVPPGETTSLILDAGAVVNGYPRYTLRGEGGQVEIIYFEKFGGAGSDLCRDDRRGQVSGITDRVRLGEGETVYEPFWVRTFRFISITLRAGPAPVVLAAPTFRKTGYPLNAESCVRSSAPWVGQLWDICRRTLENCMLETYMDCPYYEQLQFGMDTRLEMLYTYAVSRDRALARKALVDFHYGMLPDGLTPGKYPSVYLQVLSTFSLHYVIMLWEYYRETRDGELLRLCRGDVDSILDYYDRRLGPDGLVGRLDYWEFVDWQPDWASTNGIPRALLHGPSTIINLIYAYALDCGASAMDATGRACLGQEYRTRRAAVLDAVQRLCWDEAAGMYREGPAFRQFTRHAQAWAVLNGLADRDCARAILTRALADKDCLACSFSTAYEWFRALERAGMYDQLRAGLDDWIGLLDLHCTTCPETPRGARSDCHAWSALPLYELLRTVAGVQAPDPDTGVVRIAPHLLDLPDLEGTAVLPQGLLRFRYQKGPDGLWQYELVVPDGAACVFVCADGRETALTGGRHSLAERRG